LCIIDVNRLFKLATIRQGISERCGIRSRSHLPSGEAQSTFAKIIITASCKPHFRYFLTTCTPTGGQIRFCCKTPESALSKDMSDSNESVKRVILLSSCHFCLANDHGALGKQPEITHIIRPLLKMSNTLTQESYRMSSVCSTHDAKGSRTSYWFASVVRHVNVRKQKRRK
jgi:hypothetical protein